MNSNLADFLHGNKAVRVMTADDMKHFVEWLKKYDIYDLLVCNKMYYNDYAKISFWKELVKEDCKRQRKWIHPRNLSIYFGYQSDHINWYYELNQVGCAIIEAKDL